MLRQLRGVGVEKDPYMEELKVSEEKHGTITSLVSSAKEKED